MHKTKTKSTSEDSLVQICTEEIKFQTRFDFAFGEFKASYGKINFSIILHHTSATDQRKENFSIGIEWLSFCCGAPIMLSSGGKACKACRSKAPEKLRDGEVWCWKDATLYSAGGQEFCEQMLMEAGQAPLMAVWEASVMLEQTLTCLRELLPTLDNFSFVQAVKKGLP